LSPHELPRFASHCEELGFRQLWIAEDYFSYGGISAAATVLAATEEALVGIGVLASVVRHPAVAAMEFAQLAGAYPGRVIAGLGHGAPGWMRQMGLKQRSPLTALEECARSVRALLAGETVSTRGDYFSFDEVRLTHAPARPVPLFTGVHGPMSLALSGHVADGTLLGWFSTPDYVRWAIEQIDAPDHAVATLAITSIDRSEDAGRGRIEEFVLDQLRAMTRSPQITATVEAAGADPLDTYAVAGDADRCAASVEALFTAGSDQVVFVTSPGGLVEAGSMRRQADLLAEALLPAFG
jgi:alkanesulfonate monooxygenase SsuD/methylene tetrahydromethanopterin reductase-like flavin-dependent oxidoreductase (luciferase family)